MAEPDWSLLPQEPVRFFGLEEDYTRKDLKRAYGRLIKQYRPEQSPDEFRQIRDAFEQLEEWLKYRSDETAVSLNPFTNELISVQPSRGQSREESATPTPRPPRRSVGTILKEQTPEQWFLELTRESAKRPEDYIRLALVSEVIPGQPDQSFLYWLSLGLKAYPHNQSLLGLLGQYCREEETRDRPADSLRQLCEALPPSMLLNLLEPLWSTLLKNRFPQFRKLWKTYLQPYREEMAPQFIPVLIPWLIPAVWVADEKWLDDQLTYIESHNDLVMGNYDFLLEFFEVLRRFRTTCENRGLENLEESTFGAFYQELQRLCLLRNQKEIEHVWDFQRELVETFEDWSNSFRPGQDTKFQQLLAMTWEWSSHYARQQQMHFSPQLDETQSIFATRDFLRNLQGSTVPDVLRRIAFVAIAIGIYFFLTQSLISLSLKGFWAAALTMACLVSALIASWWITRRVFRWWRHIRYQHRVRPQAARFLAKKRPGFWSFHFTLQEMIEQEEEEFSDFQREAGKILANDPALRIYRAALDFE